MSTRRWLTGLAFVIFGGTGVTIAVEQAAVHVNKSDPWEPVRFLLGEWEGTAKGQSGTGTVTRSYNFVLGDRFLFEKNISTYPSQTENKTGEIHEHWSFFSRDRGRKVLILRQFHMEGFVNEYALDSLTIGTGKLVFEGERYENFDNSWRLRETYNVISPDEFIETFEIGAPGKELEVYSTNHFTRKKS